LGGLLFTPTHFQAFCNLVGFSPSSLSPSIIDDTHIIGHVLVVSQIFHHFSSELNLIGLAVQLCKCVTWSPLKLPSWFLPTSWFCTPLEGIKVLGVPLGSFSFTSSFYSNVLDNVV
jgi:hypothetical protein